MNSSTFEGGDPNYLQLEPLLLAAAKAIDNVDQKYSLQDILPVLRRLLPAMTVAELLKAFFATWRCDPHIFDPQEIFSALRSTSRQDFADDIDAWMLWFLGLQSPQLEEHKLWLEIQYKIYRTEQKPRSDQTPKRPH